jgi:hypothetical protein
MGCQPARSCCTKINYLDTVEVWGSSLLVPTPAKSVANDTSAIRHFARAPPPSSANPRHSGGTNRLRKQSPSITIHYRGGNNVKLKGTSGLCVGVAGDENESGE